MHRLLYPGAMLLSLGLVVACSSNQQSVALADDLPVEQIGWPMLPASLTSGLSVPPGETFRLGGGQRGGFTAAATNKGRVAAELFVLRDGERLEIATLQPSERGAFRFEAGDALLVRNGDRDTTAQLRVEVRGDTNLSMVYEQN